MALKHLNVPYEVLANSPERFIGKLRGLFEGKTSYGKESCMRCRYPICFDETNMSDATKTDWVIENYSGASLARVTDASYQLCNLRRKHIKATWFSLRVGDNLYGLARKRD